MDIAAFMTWIRETIMKMGGMQTCDLVYEETNPEGHYFQDIFTVGTNIGHAWPIFVLRYSVSSLVVPKMEEGISGTGAVKNSK